MVHNVSEYVRFHQEKLRKEQAGAASSSSTPTSQSQSTSTSTKRKGGVNQIHSMQSFKTAVLEASSSKIVVVDYFATWCGPCKVIAPKVAQMSNEDKYSGVDFVKIDVDEAGDVAAQEGIRAMPTFIIYKDGKKADEVVGANERELRNKIDALLTSIKEGTPYVATPSAQSFNIMSYLPFLMIAYLLYNYFFAGK